MRYPLTIGFGLLLGFSTAFLGLLVMIRHERLDGFEKHQVYDQQLWRENDSHLLSNSPSICWERRSLAKSQQNQDRVALRQIADSKIELGESLREVVNSTLKPYPDYWYNHADPNSRAYQSARSEILRKRRDAGWSFQYLDIGSTDDYVFLRTNYGLDELRLTYTSFRWFVCCGFLLGTVNAGLSVYLVRRQSRQATIVVKRYRRVLFEVVDDVGRYQRISFLWKLSGQVYKLRLGTFDRKTFKTTDRLETLDRRNTALLVATDEGALNLLKRTEEFSLYRLRRLLPDKALQLWHNTEERLAKRDLLAKAKAMAKAGRSIRTVG